MTKQELIIALRYMADGNRFPREECEKCPLYPAMGERERCVDCIDNVLRNAAWMIENQPEWISVEHEIPPCDGQSYAVLYRFPHSQETHTGIQQWHENGSNGYVYRPHFADEGMHGLLVTHWMELPAAPEEGQDADDD